MTDNTPPADESTDEDLSTGAFIADPLDHLGCSRLEEVFWAESQSDGTLYGLEPRMNGQDIKRAVKLGSDGGWVVVSPETLDRGDLERVPNPAADQSYD
jgi:hypothetical protein